MIFEVLFFFKSKAVSKYCLYRSFKVGLLPSKKICAIFLIERPLKVMKNAFYFILKALFLLKTFKFCHDFVVMWEKRPN